jgi:hypothetical protein
MIRSDFSSQVNAISTHQQGDDAHKYKNERRRGHTLTTSAPLLRRLPVEMD